MATLPFADVGAVTEGRPLLVLAPHADDESLGCGGLIAQACAAGAPVHVAIMTDGSRSHPNSRAFPAPRLAALRQAEAREAVAVLGLPPEHLAFFGYQDAAAPCGGGDLAVAAAGLAAFVQARAIGTVCATWAHDPHCDHEATHRIAAAAAGLAGFRHLSYAVWGWTLPAATWLAAAPVEGFRLGIAGELARKRQAIACHRSQLGGFINDDPEGFALPQALLDLCDRPFETYLYNPA